MNELAVELNDVLNKCTIGECLSDYGKRMYFPKGIVAQSAAAKAKATNHNATVGQAFINIAVNTALMPVTGITLPFVSYGGSSLVASLVGIGILLNISTNNHSYAGSTNRWRNRRTRYTQRRRYKRA